MRYEHPAPGDLLHLDVKKLARIPDGGGHRAHGRSSETTRGRSAGLDYLHVAVDDHSRYAYVETLPDERGATCAAFLERALAHFRTRGVAVRRVLTDNARNYTVARVFLAVADANGLTLKLTRPYRPQTNGKAERFIQTLLNEWAYARPYRSNAERLHSSRAGSTATMLADRTAASAGLPPPRACKQRSWDLHLADSRAAHLASVDGIKKDDFYRLASPSGGQDWSVMSFLEGTGDHDREHHAQIETLLDRHPDPLRLT